jgi:hypothetical protein
MSKADREVVADWLIVIGAVTLFGSLFLTWSHQLSPSFLALFGRTDLLRDVPRDPTAWQVYSAADVALMLLSAGLFGVALAGNRPLRLTAFGGTLIGLVFTIRALAHPPANGAANIFHPDLSVPSYVAVSPSAGVGETVAIVGLVLALAGLVVSFTAD